VSLRQYVMLFSDTPRLRSCMHVYIYRGMLLAKLMPAYTFCDLVCYFLLVKECLFCVFDVLACKFVFDVVETDSESEVGFASVPWC